jgi:hypothetical protein
MAEAAIANGHEKRMSTSLSFSLVKVELFRVNEGENFVMLRYPSAPFLSGADSFMWKPMRLDGYAVAL